MFSLWLDLLIFSALFPNKKKMAEITSQEKCGGGNIHYEQHLWNIHVYVIVYVYPFFLFSLFLSELS